MGDAADDAEQAYWEAEAYWEEEQRRKESIPAYHWMMRDGTILDMHNMTTTHLMNCIKFADDNKRREIDVVLQHRASP